MGPSQDDANAFNNRFKDLYAQYKEKLMRVVLQQLWRGQSSAESVIQEVLLSYAGHLRHAETGEMEEDELWRLLFRIALRHCDNANHRTRRARSKGRLFMHFSQQGGREEGSYDPPDRQSVAEQLESATWIEHVLVRLRQKGLDAQECEVLRLMLARHTLKEIARETGLTVGRVRAVTACIRRTFAACVQEVTA